MDFAYDLKELGEYFKCYAGLMAHWKALLGDQLIEVHYENLVSDPSTTLKPLLSALDLPWEDALLSHQDHVGRVDTLSLYQVRQPLHKKDLPNDGGNMRTNWVSLSARWIRRESSGLVPMIGLEACSIDLLRRALPL